MTLDIIWDDSEKYGLPSEVLFAMSTLLTESLTRAAKNWTSPVLLIASTLIQLHVYCRGTSYCSQDDWGGSQSQPAAAPCLIDHSVMYEQSRALRRHTLRLPANPTRGKCTHVACRANCPRSFVFPVANFPLFQASIQIVSLSFTFPTLPSLSYT